MSPLNSVSASTSSASAAAANPLYSISNPSAEKAAASASSKNTQTHQIPLQKKVDKAIGEAFISQSNQSTFQTPQQDQGSLKKVKKDYKKIIDDAQILLTNGEMTDQKMRHIYETIFLFAGRTSLTPKFCSICLNPGALANSHIVPNNILSHLGNFFISSRSPNEHKSAANVTWKLFCRPKCEEERLSKMGEQGFALIIHKFIENLIEARLKGNAASLVTSDQSIHYCVASIIFRYMIVNGKRDLQLFIEKFGSKVEDAFWRFFFLLRNYTLDKNSVKRPHIEFYIDEEELGKNTLITTLCTTYPTESTECMTTGHFSFKGLHFLIVESTDLIKKDTKDFALPHHGFSKQITFEPQTIVVKSKHVLTLPYIIERALQLDSIVYQKTIQKVNGSFLASQKSAAAASAAAAASVKPKVPSEAAALGSVIPKVGVSKSSITLPAAPSAPEVVLPMHPLVTDALEFYNQPPLVIRLPDEIQFIKKGRKTGELHFDSPDKYSQIYTEIIPSFQIWFIYNKPAKQMFSVINHYDSKNNVVYGFSLDQTLFQKNDLDSLTMILESSDQKLLKKFLGLVPLSKTDHLGIKWLTESIANDHLIANILESTHFLRKL